MTTTHRDLDQGPVEITGARAPQRSKPPSGVAYTLEDKPGSRHAAELLQQVVNVRYQRAADLKQQAQAEELEANRLYTTGVARIVKDHWGNTIADGTKVSIDLQKGLIKAEPA